jgi:hypothetical protein
LVSETTDIVVISQTANIVGINSFIIVFVILVQQIRSLRFAFAAVLVIVT